MRIQSGITDQYIYFVAVDTVTGERKTGLSSFTVYRSRNGGAAAAYTTPTVNETDATNMPGVYELLMDEDMTIDSGDDSQEICLHVTATGMVPITRTIELYRPTVTAGETLTVSSGVGSANMISAAGTAWASGAITAAVFAADAITAAKVAVDVGTEIGTAVWATAARTLTAGTNIVLAKGTGITGFNDLDAAGVATAVWNAATATYGSAGSYGLLVETNLDAAVSSRLSTAGYTAPDNASIAAILVDTAVIGAAGAGLTAIPWNPAWDTEVQSECADALTAFGTATAADVSALPTAIENADALLDRDIATGTDSGGRTVRNALRPLRNKISNTAGTLTVTKEDDSTTAWTASITTDAGAVPIIGVDPT